jgi:hypothetical protein
VGPGDPATFERRKTPLPLEPPLALTPAFATDAVKRQQCQAFIRKGKLEGGGDTLEDVCACLSGFLMPPTQALASGQAWTKHWLPAGPWSDDEPS